MLTATATPPVAEQTARKSPPMVRVDNELLAELDEWVAELQRRPGTVGTVTRSDVVRAILARRLKERAKGETP